jgi:hypothetical protein
LGLFLHGKNRAKPRKTAQNRAKPRRTAQNRAERGRSGGSHARNEIPHGGGAVFKWQRAWEGGAVPLATVVGEYASPYLHTNERWKC